MKTEHKEFLKELKALLEKHRASISATCSEFSDLHGVFDEKIEISIRRSDTGWASDIVFETEGWSLDADDLKEVTK